ncbi:unnamed protein product [Auanema sp. JU1783]|nr:unnamed protein product [Auanema sp. JU1783]
MVEVARRKISSRRRESRRWKDPPDKALRAKDILIRASSLTEDKNLQAVQFLGLALETCGIENEIATFLKKKCDQTFGMSWQCIVGRNFGSHLDCVEYIHLTISKISVLIFRCK